MKKVLYHGTPHQFEEFDQTKIGSKDAIDQYGSGIYFYNTPDKTIRHGNIMITAMVRINKTIDVNKVYKKQLTKDCVESMIIASPSFDEKICMHSGGDINYYGINKVLKGFVNTYRELDYLSMLNCIGNDFYDPNETYALLKKFVEVTGYNAIVNKELGIYNILTIEQITIKKIEYVE